MTESEKDRALRRGAEAGYALALTLKDICGVHSAIAIAAAIAAMTLLAELAGIYPTMETP